MWEKLPEQSFSRFTKTEYLGTWRLFLCSHGSHSDYPHNLQSPNQSETTELNLFSSKAIVFGPMLPKQMFCFWNVQVGEYEMKYSGPII